MFSVWVLVPRVVVRVAERMLCRPGHQAANQPLAAVAVIRALLSRSS